MEKTKCKSPPVSIELVTPAATTVAQAKKELEYIKEEEPRSGARKRKRRRNRGRHSPIEWSLAKQGIGRKPAPLFEKQSK